MKVADGVVEREGKSVQSKRVKERKDEVRLKRTKADQPCDLQPWQSHFSLWHKAISLQTLSPEHIKLKRVG